MITPNVLQLQHVLDLMKSLEIKVTATNANYVKKVINLALIENLAKKQSLNANVLRYFHQMASLVSHVILDKLLPMEILNV